jgi:hypothetical protein
MFPIVLTDHHPRSVYIRYLRACKRKPKIIAIGLRRTSCSTKTTIPLGILHLRMCTDNGMFFNTGDFFWQ